MPKKTRQQKTVSYLPSYDEKHTSGYNWNGPGTKIYDRISLKYKGKVGTKSYWLPINKLDMQAFQHDLLYYSPNNIVRAYADSTYVEGLHHSKASRVSIYPSVAAINAQRAARIVSAAAPIPINVGVVQQSLKFVGKILAVPPLQLVAETNGKAAVPVQQRAIQIEKYRIDHSSVA